MKIKSYIPHITVFGVLTLAACQSTVPSESQTPQSETQSAAHTVRPWDRWAEHRPGWITPREPFNIIANIYYVGSKELSSFLITSEAGHVLLDGGLPQNAPQIVRNIKTLGFDIKDVKILLNSHAHYDHSGGLAALKAQSGATVIASAADKPWLENGLYPGSADKRYSAPPVMVDRTITDQEKITLGSITMKANLTPGHSPGCTSWTMEVPHGSDVYEVLFFCSATVAKNTLVNPPQYDGIVSDYRKTFDITNNWEPDIFLSNHPFFFGMEAKLKAREGGDPLAFIDRKGFPRLMKNLEKKFDIALKEQTEAANP